MSKADNWAFRWIGSGRNECAPTIVVEGIFNYREDFADFKQALDILSELAPHRPNTRLPMVPGGADVMLALMPAA